MTRYKITIRENEITNASAEKVKKIRKRRWKKRMHIRAVKIKRQLQLENKFHHAMREIRTTTDRYRESYLHWILHHMFSVFDYESGLLAIHDRAAYEAWLSVNDKRREKRY